MVEKILKITNDEYRSMDGITASLLKQALLSPAHAKAMLDGKKKATDAMNLGTAIHAYFLERERFDAEYRIETETYAKNYGEHKAGDPKLDEDGEPLQSLVFPDGITLIKGETFKKFKAMAKALDNCDKAQELLVGGETEVSYIDRENNEKCRADLITSDGWIVDLKTVGTLNELPLDNEQFARTFYDMGYDVQMKHYWDIIAKVENVKGFIFLCVDSREPVGVKMFVFDEHSKDWLELADLRKKVAYKNLEVVQNNADCWKYKELVCMDLPLPYKALETIKQGE